MEHLIGTTFGRCADARPPKGLLAVEQRTIYDSSAYRLTTVFLL